MIAFWFSPLLNGYVQPMQIALALILTLDIPVQIFTGVEKNNIDIPDDDELNLLAKKKTRRGNSA